MYSREITRDQSFFKVLSVCISVQKVTDLQCLYIKTVISVRCSSVIFLYSAFSMKQ